MNNNKYKILIVEDEDNIIKFISALFEANGYQVICSKNVESALSLFSSYIPDLVILDLGLPDKDGTEFIKSNRQ